MDIEKETEQFFDGLRKVLFYVGHGKYNDFMSLEEVQTIKTTLEKVLELEEEYEKATSSQEKEAIHKRIEPYKTYSVKDFISLNIEKI